MDINIITKEDGGTKTAFQQITQMKQQLKGIEKNCRPLFNGERFLTDAEGFTRLSISRRTLQESRDKNMIKYIKLASKILYRESDIERMLGDHSRR